jgi:hypothetical protein
MTNLAEKQRLKGLLAFGISITLAGCNTLSSQAPKTESTPQQKADNPSPISSPVSPVTEHEQQLRDLSSAEVVLLAITPEEVELREQQVKTAKEIEKLGKLRNQAGLGGLQDPLKDTYQRLNSEIQLLQAKQLLQLKQQQEKKK